MQIKLLQLNMWAGTFFNEIKAFLQQNDFDILCFQEVSGQGAVHGNVNAKIDCFEELSTLLQKTHIGELAIAQYAASNPITGYFGNAIFYKKEFSLLNKEILWLYKRTSPFPIGAKTFEEVGRNLLYLTLEKEKKQCEILTTHLAWATTKYEQPHQTDQNTKLISYMKTLTKPWIITGDFNLMPNQPTILKLEQLGRDVPKEYGIKNTIDPINHKKWEQFKPGGAIDYIFVSPDIQVNNFEVLENVHMSDHFGLTATIDF